MGGIIKLNSETEQKPQQLPTQHIAMSTGVETTSFFTLYYSLDANLLNANPLAWEKIKFRNR